MTDFATPNLPARDFDATIAFYAPLGFTLRYRDEYWMILERGAMMLEFFPFPDLDPAESAFGSCLRMTGIDGLYADARAAGIPETRQGWPRLDHPPHVMPWGARMAAMVDLDGSLIRMIEN